MDLQPSSLKSICEIAQQKLMFFEVYNLVYGAALLERQWKLNTHKSRNVSGVISAVVITCSYCHLAGTQRIII